MSPETGSMRGEEEIIPRILDDVGTLSMARHLSAVFLLPAGGFHGASFDPVRKETIYSGFEFFFFTRLRESVVLNILNSSLRRLAVTWSDRLSTRVFFHPVCPESAVSGDTLFIQMLKRHGRLLHGSEDFLRAIPDLPPESLQKTEPLHHIAFSGLNLLSSIHRLNGKNLSIVDILRAKLLLSLSAMYAVDAFLLSEKRFDYDFEGRIRNLQQIIGERRVSTFDPVPMLESYRNASDFLRNPRFLPVEVVAGDMERTLDLWRPVFLYIVMSLCGTGNVFTEDQAVRQLILHKDELTTEPAAELVMTNLNHIFELRDKTLMLSPRLKFVIRLAYALFDKRCIDPVFAAGEYHMLRHAWELFFQKKRGK